MSGLAGPPGGAGRSSGLLEWKGRALLMETGTRTMEERVAALEEARDQLERARAALEQRCAAAEAAGAG